MSNESRTAYRVRIGDTQKPFGMVLKHSGNPVDVASLTVKFVALDNPSGATVVTESSDNVTKQPTTTFTVDTSENYLLANDHVVREGDQVVLSNSGGGLPTGLTASTRYFARDVRRNAFRVSAYEGTSPVDFTGAGTGTHSFYIVGHVQHDWQAAHVNQARKMRAWFITLDGSSEEATFPPDADGWPVVVS